MTTVIEPIEYHCIKADIFPDTIKNLPNDEYHNGFPYRHFVSSTQLKDYYISPMFAKFKRKNPQLFKISKESSEVGSLYHYCLESLARTGDLGEYIKNVVIFNPPINPKTGAPFGRETKTYTEQYELFLLENEGKMIVSKSDYELVDEMTSRLVGGCRQTSIDVKKLIKWGEPEVSHFVEYEGCKFKYRPDLETKKKIVDWKTVAADDLHESTIAKIIIKFKYDISAAFYQFFEHERTGVWKDFFWVFQQKQPPYDAIIVSAEKWAYDFDGDIVKMGSGALKFKTILDQHIWCEQNNDWRGAEVFVMPGFKKQRILVSEPPLYEQTKLITYYND